ATAPAGFQFVACGGSATIGSPPTSASQPVTVPSGGTGTATFYVAPATVPSQTLAGHIFDCTAGIPTSSERLGGALSAAGPQNVPAISNPLAPTSVSAGTYTMTASAPAGFQFVPCGGSATVGSPPTSATATVVVPVGGSGTGVFYVAPATVPSQTIAGNIFDCTTGTPTTDQVTGGSLAATGPQTLTAQANPLPPTNVAAGTYSMTATAPPGYQFVTCGASATPGTPPTTASTTVTVPPGGAGTGTFYVAAVPVTVSATKTNNAGGTFAQSGTSNTPGGDVTFQVTFTNTSAVPVVVKSVTDAWPAQAPFSPTCSTAVVGTVLAPGASATCQFTVANYVPPAGTFVTNTASVTTCQLTNPVNCVTASPTSTVNSVAVLGEQITQPPTTTPAAPAPVPTQVLGNQLSFTGAPSALPNLIRLAVLLMTAGFGLTLFARLRRRRGTGPT
ncbi:MAG TPA: hypothetical protein VFH45_03640, partial [Acidimicrobiales bacterium]|nr:hypothetical protein [Acidimicrobiales bacterium]